MKIRLYLDEDSMRHSLVHALRSRGVDVHTALEAGLIGTPDEEHLKYATNQGRVLYSFNVGDFFALHSIWIAQSQHHTGVVLAQQQQYSVREQLRRLLRLISATSAKQMKNHVEFLSGWSG